MKAVPSSVGFISQLCLFLNAFYLFIRYSLIEKYNLKKIRFHDLRHTCASLLLSKGISMKQIQIWLGHSTFSTTADIYAHLDYSAQEESASAMTGMFTRTGTEETTA